MKAPSLSIITPTHNPEWLADTWRSLKTQTYPDWEWIVLVNNPRGNRARIKEIADSVAKIVKRDPRVQIKIDYSPFAGVGARKLVAFGWGSGDVLVELDHDDLLTPDALAEIDIAFRDPEIGFVHSDSADFDGTKDPHAKDHQGSLTYRAPDVRRGWLVGGAQFYEESIGGVRPGKYECVRMPTDALAFSHIYQAPNHVRAWRRSVYEQLGGHNPDFRLCDDHELIVRTYLATKTKHIPKPLYLYRISGDNTWAKDVNFIKQTSDRLQIDYLERLVLRECEVSGFPAYDLGGGINPREGWKSVDLKNGAITADLRERWPWEDESVGAFRAFDLLEHLPDKQHTVQEIHRCLKPGGYLISLTPSTDGRGAFMDPTHVSYWCEQSWWYYTRDEQAMYIGNDAIRFNVVHLRTDFPSPWHVQNRISYVYANLVKPRRP